MPLRLNFDRSSCRSWSVMATIGVIVVALQLPFPCLGSMQAAAPGIDPFRNNPTPSTSVWPIPVEFSRNRSVLAVTPVDVSQFSLESAPWPNCINVTGNSYAASAFARFQAAAFPRPIVPTTPPSPPTLPPGWSHPPVSKVVLCVTSDLATLLQLGVDESYELFIPGDFDPSRYQNASGSSFVSLNCSTLYGCYHGLETLSQLIVYNVSANWYAVRETPIFIRDYPRFPHRGLMVDSARHFLPLSALYSAIDAMRFAKLNTLHWHMVDAQSFPFVAPSHPEIAANGAFSSYETYTIAEVTLVVEYARQRGVRVVPEFDSPGHTGAMCFGIPSICPDPLCTSLEINRWALDITKNETYAVVNAIIGDLASVFFDDYFHIGGDEVDSTCWSERPAIVQWFAAHGMTLADGYVYYGKQIHDMVIHKRNRSIIGWQEMYENFGPNGFSDPLRVVVQQWIPKDGWGTFTPDVAFSQNVTSHGFRLLWSDASRYYLDFLNVNWTAIYSTDPCDGLTDTQCALVVGGEGCMWGEHVDSSDFQATVWPRAAAIAGKLWSPRAATSGSGDSTSSSSSSSSSRAPAAVSEATRESLVQFRCLLNRRGIGAAPPENRLARSAPEDASSCFYEFPLDPGASSSGSSDSFSASSESSGSSSSRASTSAPVTSPSMVTIAGVVLIVLALVVAGVIVGPRAWSRVVGGRSSSSGGGDEGGSLIMMNGRSSTVAEAL